MKSAPNSRSITPTPNDGMLKRPSRKSTIAAIPKLAFSMIAGIIIVRYRTGSVARTRKAICHATATPMSGEKSTPAQAGSPSALAPRPYASRPQAAPQPNE